MQHGCFDFAEVMNRRHQVVVIGGVTEHPSLDAAKGFAERNPTENRKFRYPHLPFHIVVSRDRSRLGWNLFGNHTMPVDASDDS